MDEALERVSIITPVYIKSDESLADLLRLSNCIQNLHCGYNYVEWVTAFDMDSIPDKAGEILDKVKNVRVKRACLGSNYGPSTARNVAVSISTGDIIAYADMDDVLYPSAIETLTWQFDNGANVVLSAYHIQQRDELFYYMPFRAMNVEFARQQLSLASISIPLGFSHRRKLFYLAGGFQPGIVCGEDGIFLRRLFDNMSWLINLGVNQVAVGKYIVSTNGQSRTQRRFKEGGFAFNAESEKGSNGQYLDDDWFKYYNSWRNYED